MQLKVKMPMTLRFNVLVLKEMCQYITLN